MDKKKISLITFPVGGPFHWAKQLEAELQSRGFETKFYAGRKDYIEALKTKHEIVHTCVPLPFLRCDKYILTIKGNFQEEKSIARPFFKRAIRKADTITVPSQFLKKQLNLPNALVIPNGIQLPEKPKANFTLMNTAPTFGLLTNFHFRPKAEGAYRLAQIIHKVSKDAKLLIGGDGIFLEEFKPIILRVHPNTQFLGHCDKKDFFSQIDIFTYYSLLDNQPIALLEAMAFGLPVVSNRVGATGEILDGELEKYLADDDRHYQLLLVSLLQSEEIRKKLGTMARLRAEDFAWEKMINRFIKLY